MDTINIKNHVKNCCCTEKKIPIRRYRTSEALKNYIRESMLKCSLFGWNPVNIYNRGPFIILKFHRKIAYHEP
jgi:hypothetical protein